MENVDVLFLRLYIIQPFYYLVIIEIYEYIIS